MRWILLYSIDSCYCSPQEVKARTDKKKTSADFPLNFPNFTIEILYTWKKNIWYIKWKSEKNPSIFLSSVVLKKQSSPVMFSSLCNHNASDLHSFNADPDSPFYFKSDPGDKTLINHQKCFQINLILSCFNIILGSWIPGSRWQDECGSIWIRIQSNVCDPKAFRHRL